METLYDALGVDPDADREAIRAAYRERAKRHHPDVSGGSATEFRRLTAARDVLLDDARRRRYDALGYRRYARHHLGEEWPVDEPARRRHSRRSRTARSGQRRRSRRVRRERPPRSSSPTDALIALATYWPILVRVGIALALLLVLAFVLAALSL
ncbi:J domain-containing protein [Halalkalicoccus sp. NIPERK01]|uniref:J domain-containing protein n=1 Tax=Halalkalicoccus sp. NIPERK01 TaxID=3053469 RepID=UPI00256EA65D|nr:J domain-containing protein [Halalkalicoccus sp. NIPERK01]MDL5361058.1 J domain-containing protein [Halalkalicoccus sp. NIPERK01]